MSDLCAVPTCNGAGAHEIDEEARLCLKHALAWDKAAEERLARRTEMYVNEPHAREEDVWNAQKAEWLGAQQ